MKKTYEVSLSLFVVKLFTFSLILSSMQDVSAQIQVTEDTLVLPTYIVDPPNPMPRFYEGRSHQGVQRHVYPYPMNDGLTRVKEDRSYHIAYFENEYIHLGIMPGLGGRIFFAEDKTNDYNWFYRQHVIKPSLIGMLGYWISGANAWGFPHHHGPNTVKSMDYRIVENDDGSKTIWSANTDQRHRMRIIVGYTIFPHSSLVEMTIRPMNLTAISNSFLFWANPSVHVDTNYQVIFPPSVQYVTQHAKREMTTWPISDRRYNRFDYTGVDISRWKNIGVPSSFFSWDPKEDYFGGYDHAKEAGTVWIGNHYTCPGMKYWAWGNNPAGDRSNTGLTDDDGHYIELMAGAYTDNQPDYSWIQPYEGKDVKMIWFPIRNLNGLKYANRNGALNLQVAGSKALIRMNTTSPHQNAKVTLMAKGKVLFNDVILISPAAPYAADVDLFSSTIEDDLTLSLLSEKGETLLAYCPAEHHPPDVPVPEALRSPKRPEEIASVEELYLTGLRLNEFYNASLDPTPYYLEALKRDPDDYRVNTQLGILAIKAKNWEDAEKRLRTAVDRITANYTRPKDGEAQYYLGIALKSIGKLDEAYDFLYDASWNFAWHTAAYYQLAEIDCKRGDFETALDHVNRSITTQTENLKALNLRAVVMHKLGRVDDAEAQIEDILKKDILNHQARNEKAMLFMDSGHQKEATECSAELSEIMRDQVQSYLELATDYGNAGFTKEAIDVLDRLEKKGNDFPMLYYYLGYYWSKSCEQNKALDYFKTAAQKPHDYCFPFRSESVDVLNLAMEMNPKDARAPYYLGNLYFEEQPERAIELWQKSRDLDSSFYIVHRNLALAYEEIQNDIPKAMQSMENAVAYNSDDPRLLFEMDELYEKNKVSSETKYEVLQKNSETAKRRTESMLRLATRSVEVGKYDEALDILLNNEFPQFEGGREMQDTYLNAYTLRGLDLFSEGEYNPALKDFETALAYPVGRFGRSRWAQFHYLLGTVCEKLGNKEKAKESYQNCIDIDVEGRGQDQEFNFYRGLALIKMKKKKDAKKLFEDILSSTQSDESNSFFRQFEGSLSQDRRLAANHYLAGLAYEGLGKKKKAGAEYKKVLELEPGHVWSQVHLNSL
ncbi:DUF5107 domain-containing protein [candidate division KSB1 bacterium]|nr:DUF5107 domain-containing protein [candidate division KSB1 bacterium]